MQEPLHILLAEDEDNDVVLMQRAFLKIGRGDGLKVVTHGMEAIQYLTGDGEFSDRKQFPLPALCLLDLKLPYKTGFEVLEWIRQQPGLRRLLVVVLTSSSQPQDINRAYDLGANSYLVKPPTFDALLELVKRIDAYWCDANRRPDCVQREHLTAARLESVHQGASCA